MIAEKILFSLNGKVKYPWWGTSAKSMFVHHAFSFTIYVINLGITMSASVTHLDREAEYLCQPTGGPGRPSMPGTPGGPLSPWSPGIPEYPLSPTGPVMARPGCPLGPGSPGKPWFPVIPELPLLPSRPVKEFYVCCILYLILKLLTFILNYIMTGIILL